MFGMWVPGSKAVEVWSICFNLNATQGHYISKPVLVNPLIRYSLLCQSLTFTLVSCPHKTSASAISILAQIPRIPVPPEALPDGASRFRSGLLVPEARNIESQIDRMALQAS